MIFLNVSKVHVLAQASLTGKNVYSQGSSSWPGRRIWTPASLLALSGWHVPWEGKGGDERQTPQTLCPPRLQLPAIKINNSTSPKIHLLFHTQHLISKYISSSWCGEITTKSSFLKKLQFILFPKNKLKTGVHSEPVSFSEGQCGLIWKQTLTRKWTQFAENVRILGKKPCQNAYFTRVGTQIYIPFAGLLITADWMFQLPTFEVSNLASWCSHTSPRWFSAGRCVCVSEPC